MLIGMNKRKKVLRQRLMETHGMPQLRIGIRLEKNGIILRETVEDGHSWTRNAWSAFHGIMMDAGGDGVSAVGTGRLNLIDTAFTRRFSVNTGFGKSGNSLSGYGFYNNAANSIFGIVVGYGDDPFHPDDWRLSYQISHGTGAGQLSHTAQGIGVLTWSEETKKFTNTFQRIFVNDSAGSITVKEVGLIFSGLWGGYTYNFFMAHDILEAPVEILSGSRLTVTYSIVSVSFDPVESYMVEEPAMGAAGSGGYYMGKYDGWYHSKWGLILSPVSGGYSSGLKWKIENTATPGTTEPYFGGDNMAGMYAMGADSPAGAFVAAANAAELGGYSDWYLPASNEFAQFFIGRSSLPGGQEFPAGNYWTSFSNSSTTAYYGNPNSSGGTWGVAKTTENSVRLCRRILLSDWTPA